MGNTGLIFESSAGYLALFLLTAGGVAWYFYGNRSKVWSSTVNRILLATRFLLLFCILVLLLSPMLKYLQREVEEPIFVVAIDNSTSVEEMTDSLLLEQILQDQMPNLISSLDDYAIYTTSINEGMVEGYRPAQSQSGNSDLRTMLSDLENRFEGRNLAKVLLISDGIYNSGSSPTFHPFPFDIYTLGVGDTTEQKDLIIQDVRYNRISYEGNRFPVTVEVIQKGFEGENASLTLSHRGQTLDRQTLRFKENQNYAEVTFLVEAKEKGNQRYLIQLEEKSGEFTFSNNQRNVFIEVVEGKEKILIVGNKPHPDIKALKSSIETTSTYSVEVFIPGISTDNPKEDRYDLLILHQLLPGDPLIQTFANINPEKTSHWVIHSRSMGINAVNDQLPIELYPVPGQTDDVIPNVNTAFSHFSFSDELRDQITSWPPVNIPFGDITLDASTESLLFQRVGSITTSKPLMAIQEGDPKVGVTLGEGIWRWRLHDYLRNQNHQLFNEWVNKTVQYLSSKNETKKLRVYPLNNQKTDQSIVVETEVYNDLYERIYGVDVTLSVSDEQAQSKTFEYTVAPGNSRYRLSGLHPGIFSYTATVQLGDKTETERGQFVLNEQQVEFINLQADHKLLKELAESNNGSFSQAEDFPELQEEIINKESPSIIRSFESYESIINLKWVLVLLIVFATTEWFLRKFHGAY